MVRIYCLIDPRSDLPFYVGATKRDLRTRLNCHISESAMWAANYTGILASKKEVINTILSEKLRPVIKCLLIVNDNSASKFELYYYNYFTSLGVQLFQSQRRFIYNKINATEVQK